MKEDQWLAFIVGLILFAILISVHHHAMKRYIDERFEDAIVIRTTSSWGCSAPKYIGPTGDNHAVYKSQWRPQIWLDGSDLWRGQ